MPTILIFLWSLLPILILNDLEQKSKVTKTPQISSSGYYFLNAIYAIILYWI